MHLYAIYLSTVTNVLTVNHLTLEYVFSIVKWKKLKKNIIIRNNILLRLGYKMIRIDIRLTS